MGHCFNRHSVGKGVQLKEISNREEKAPSFIAYLSLSGQNDSKGPAAAKPWASISVGGLGSSQNHVNTLPWICNCPNACPSIVMLVSCRCFRGPPRLQQHEDDDQICPDKGALELPPMPHQPSLQPSANLFRGLSLGVKSPVQQFQASLKNLG